MSAEIAAMPKSDRQMLEEIHAMTLQTRNDIEAIRVVIDTNVAPVIERIASNPMLASFLG